MRTCMYSHQHSQGHSEKNFRCATALYYYDSENISESPLALRQLVDDGSSIYHEKNDLRALEAIYGFENEQPSIRTLGDIVTKVTSIFVLVG